MASRIQRTFVATESATGRQNPAGFHPCQGIWHTATGHQPRVAVLASHYEVDFSEHYLAPLLAERGVGFLGWNTRFRNNGTYFLLEHALVDIAAGVQWLRANAGVQTVVLLGNCGGGPLMASYQSQATEPTLEASAGLRLPRSVEELPPGDLYVSLQAHLGRPEVLTSWMDPSVTDESDPLSRAPALDMYDSENGPPYDEAFVTTYRSAQEARNHRITDWVHAELDRMRAQDFFDRTFSVPRTWADLRFLDPSLDPSEREPGRCLAGEPGRANKSPYGIASTSTLRSWLSMWSLRESPCRGEQHLSRIAVPSLVAQSTADVSVFPSDALRIFDALTCEDKESVWLKGDHYLESPQRARSETADVIAAWIADRVD